MPFLFTKSWIHPYGQVDGYVIVSSSYVTSNLHFVSPQWLADVAWAHQRNRHSTDYRTNKQLHYYEWPRIGQSGFSFCGVTEVLSRLFTLKSKSV